MMFFWLWCAGWLVVSGLLLLPVRVPAVIGSDLVAHFALFAAMALGTVTFCHDPLRLTGLALLTLAGSIALEVAQALVPYRTFDLLDAMANAIGIGVGYLAALLVYYLVVRPTRPRRRQAQGRRIPDVSRGTLS
jgi:VanZ family protein